MADTCGATDVRSRRLVSVAPQQAVVTIGFHHVSDAIDHYTAVSKQRFREIVVGLQQHANVVSLEQALDAMNGGELPPRPVLLTFDDAYEDIFEPLQSVAEDGLGSAVVFPVSGWIGRRNLWNRKTRYVARHLDREQLLTLIGCGFRIGSHTREHHYLPKLGAEDLEVELLESRRELESLLQTTVPVVAYPFGSHSPAVCEAASRSYSAAFTTETKSGVRVWNDDPYRIRRLMVTRSTTWPELWSMMLREWGS